MRDAETGGGVRGWGRIACVALALSTLAAAPASAADASDFNLARLALLLERHEGELEGELGEFAERVREAGSLRRRLLLRRLLPELSTHRALRRRPPVDRLEPSARAPRPRRSAFHGLARGLDADDSRAPRTVLWTEGIRDASDQDDRDGVDGFEADSTGVRVGIERELLAGVALGVSAARVVSDVDSDRFGRDDVESLDYAAYARASFGRHSVTVDVAVRDSEIDRLRAVRFVTPLGIRVLALTSEIDTTETQTGASWIWAVDLDERWTLAPSLSLSYARVETDDYLESGGGNLGLVVETDDESRLVGGAGLTLGYFAYAGAWALAPQAYVFVDHDFVADETRTLSRFRGTRFAFESRGYGVERTRLRAGLGLGLYHVDGFGATLGFDFETRADYGYRAFALGLEYAF